jgi:hypothetical protein
MTLLTFVWFVWTVARVRQVAQSIAVLKNLPESVLRGFRDATHTSSSFWLSIEDCVSGVRKAYDAGWFNIRDFDLDEYDLWDQNLSGYLHKVCPRLIALRGPADKAGMCPPEEFIEYFQDQNVTDVIRLSNGDSELYDPAVYTDQGIALHEVGFHPLKVCGAAFAALLSRI